MAMHELRGEVEVVFVRNHQIMLGRADGADPWALPAAELRQSDVAASEVVQRLAAELGLTLLGEARLLGSVKEPAEDPLFLQLMANVCGQPSQDSSDASSRRHWAWFPLADVPETCRARCQQTIAEASEQVVRDAVTAFDSLFGQLADTPLLADINRAVLGTDIGQYGFLSASELVRILDLARSVAEGPILEIGAGQGGLACALAKAGRSVVALEPSPVALLSLRMNARIQGIGELSSHRGRAERFCDLDSGEELASGQFAAVVGADFSYFVSELDRFAHEAFRVLRPGGQLLFAAVCPVSANDVADSLVCGPFMRVPDRIVRLLTGVGFRVLGMEDWTPGYAEVVRKYLAATNDRIDVLRDAIGTDAVRSWLNEFTVEQALLKNARIVRLLFRAEKSRDRELAAASYVPSSDA